MRVMFRMGCNVGAMIEHSKQSFSERGAVLDGYVGRSIVSGSSVF